MRVATDFNVGQKVSCSDPSRFVSQVERYLKNRVGLVMKVYPKGETPEQLRHFENKVQVEWQKKGGRGKVEVMWMHPDDIEPCEDLAQDDHAS